MNVLEGLFVVGATAGGVWLTREVLTHNDLHGARATITDTGTDVAEKVGHVLGGIGRTTGDLVEKSVTGGGKLVATGTGAMLGFTTSAAERLLFVHREPEKVAAEPATTRAAAAPRPARKRPVAA
jgi:hypothetical protein